jgi:hypothetical protein
MMSARSAASSSPATPIIVPAMEEISEVRNWSSGLSADELGILHRFGLGEVRMLGPLPTTPRRM